MGQVGPNTEQEKKGWPRWAVVASLILVSAAFLMHDFGAWGQGQISARTLPAGEFAERYGDRLTVVNNGNCYLLAANDNPELRRLMEEIERASWRVKIICQPAGPGWGPDVEVDGVQARVRIPIPAEARADGSLVRGPASDEDMVKVSIDTQAVLETTLLGRGEEYASRVDHLARHPEEMIFRIVIPGGED